MQRKHVRVFKQMNEKSFAGLLQGEDRRTLPTEPSVTVFPTGVGNHVKRNLAHLLSDRSNEKRARDKKKGAEGREDGKAIRTTRAKGSLRRSKSVLL